MRFAAASFLSLALACAHGARRAEEGFRDAADAVPGLVLDIRYATSGNFTGRVLYPEARCLLRETVAKRLAQVQNDLKNEGLGLKVWDCYRPLAIQKALWKLVPDPRYVADPAKGSRHNRGAAVDVTLIDRTGKQLEMPTDYDDFSVKAHREDKTASAQAAANSLRLERAMARRGFTGLATEWWHFDADGWRDYPVTDAPLSRP